MFGTTSGLDRGSGAPFLFIAVADGSRHAAVSQVTGRSLSKTAKDGDGFNCAAAPSAVHLPPLLIPLSLSLKDSSWASDYLIIHIPIHSLMQFPEL